jgi:hypothetical protein
MSALQNAIVLRLSCCGKATPARAAHCDYEIAIGIDLTGIARLLVEHRNVGEGAADLGSEPDVGAYLGM